MRQQNQTTTAVLVLDGHTNQALACVRSLGRAGYTVWVASPRRWPLAAWSRYCVGSFLLAGETRAAWAALRTWAARRGVQLVLPITERACWLCNQDRAAWEAAGIIVGCAPQAQLDLAFDKGLTLRLAADCGVRIPPTFFPAARQDCEAAAEQIGFPCVIKPRRSNAWEGQRFLPDHGCAYAGGLSELAALIEPRRQGAVWPLLQGYVAGKGAGVFALCDHGQPLAWFAHERLRDVNPTGSGSSLRRAAPLPQRLRAPAERLLAAMRWHGPAMVEFRDDGVEPPCLMEVNGRFWGSLQLALDAGVDFPRYWVELLLGQPVKPPEHYDESATVRWLWGDVKRLLYVMQGPPRGYRGAFPTRAQGWRELFGPQPPGTRLEVWRAEDRWPAVAEMLQGGWELLANKERSRAWRAFWRTRIQSGRTMVTSPSKSG
jgi:predicted ATP-grasp superfamily ATP-dependent carboligase